MEMHLKIMRLLKGKVSSRDLKMSGEPLHIFSKGDLKMAKELLHIFGKGDLNMAKTKERVHIFVREIDCRGTITHLQ